MDLREDRVDVARMIPSGLKSIQQGIRFMEARRAASKELTEDEAPTLRVDVIGSRAIQSFRQVYRA